VTRVPPTRLVIGVVLAFATGWLASAAWLGLAPLRYGETLDGTVALVNDDATKLCLQPDGGGELRCGELIGPRGAVGPVIGQHLTIVTAWLRSGSNLEQQVFLIAPATRDGS